MTTVKAVDREGMSNTKHRARNAGGARDIHKVGVENEKINEPHPNYNAAPCEKIIEGENNQFIILGRDRPGGRTTGYGGAGDTHSGRIEFVVGMSGMNAKESITVNKKSLFGLGPLEDHEEDILTDGSPYADAAKIYMSQRTDIDENFNLTAGKVGNFGTPDGSGPRSAIAMKADAIRIISRDAGIKLVAGGTDATNSQGADVMGGPRVGIDLITGNDDTGLEPLVKGNELKKLLEKLVKIISEVNSAAAQNSQTLTTLGAALTAAIITAPDGAPLAALGGVSIATGVTQQVNMAALETEIKLGKYHSRYNNTN